MSLHAVVRNGRIVLDEPTELPDGTALALVPMDEVADLDPEDRARLIAALDLAAQQFEDGHVQEWADVLSGLRQQASRVSPSSAK